MGRVGFGDQELGFGHVILELLRDRAGIWSLGLSVFLFATSGGQVTRWPRAQTCGAVGEGFVSNGQTMWPPLWSQAEVLWIE